MEVPLFRINLDIVVILKGHVRNIFSRFLFDVDCPLYLRYRRKVDTLRKGFIAESTSRKEDADTSKKSKRKSRWGDESDKVALFQPGVAVGQGGSGGGGRNPVLIQYAIKVFGTTDLEPSQWKQCEDQLKVVKAMFVCYF